MIHYIAYNIKTQFVVVVSAHLEKLYKYFMPGTSKYVYGSPEDE